MRGVPGVGRLTSAIQQEDQVGHPYHRLKGEHDLHRAPCDEAHIDPYTTEDTAQLILVNYQAAIDTGVDDDCLSL